MDSHVAPLSAKDMEALDLASCSPAPGPSLLDVVAASMAQQLPRFALPSIPTAGELPLFRLVALGLVLGTGLGFLLI